ncbi:ATP-binding cassette domain-containing protein [Kribbella swartbergensis]
MTNRTLETVDLTTTEETGYALAARTENLSVRFAGVPALDRLDLRLAPGKIHGLLGRNGSGKSTLAAVLAGFRQPDDGRVLIEGGDLGTAAEPYENAVVTGRICLIRESGDLIDAAPVKHVLGLAASLRPYWDADLAGELLDRFEVPTNKKVQKLSRGKKSALGVVLGLASRAPLTIFDETYLGMDVPSRNLFYDALLADYAEVPRTIVLSTHLVSEVSTMLEEVVILDSGRLVTQSPVDALRGRGASIVGPAAAVDEFTAGFTVLAEEKLGGTKSATILGDLDPESVARAGAAGLEIGPVGLQDLFVHLTSNGKGVRR